MTETAPQDNTNDDNRKKIRKLESEVDILMKQILENDENEQQRKQHDETTTKIMKELKEAKELEEQLQLEIDNLKTKIQELEDQNEDLTSENLQLKNKNEETKKDARKKERKGQKALEDKATLEQVANEKSRRISVLETHNNDLKEMTEQQALKIQELETQLQHQSTTQQEKPSVTLLGDSNCRDIHPHLMRWLNQDVENVWAPTLEEARNWIDANTHSLEGTTVILLAGTNDLKNGKDRQTEQTEHRETTKKIYDTGANLIVMQLPPVYHPQLRHDQRQRDTEIINEIIIERHGSKVARTDKISLHRAQMRKDGLHITNESAEIMADELTQVVNETNQPTPPTESLENFQITFNTNTATTEQENIKSTEVHTTKQIAGRIIGIGGERIKKIKNIYGVEINTTETNNNTRTFTITGNQQDITKATKIIKAIAKEAQEKDSDRAETSPYTNSRPEAMKKMPTRCRFFAYGNCKRGSKCRYQHTQGPADVSMHTESDDSYQEQEREPTPQRTVVITPNQKEREHPNNRDDKGDRKPPTKRKHRTPPKEHQQQDRYKTPERRQHKSKGSHKSRRTSPSPTRTSSSRDESPRRPQTSHRSKTSRRATSSSSHSSSRDRTSRYRDESSRSRSSRRYSPPGRSQHPKDRSSRKHSPKKASKSERHQDPSRRRHHHSTPSPRREHHSRRHDRSRSTHRTSHDDRSYDPRNTTDNSRRHDRSRSSHRTSHDDRSYDPRNIPSTSSRNRTPPAPHRSYRRERMDEDRDLSEAIRTILNWKGYK